MVWSCSTHSKERVLMVKSEGKGPHGRYRRRYGDNIKIEVKGKVWMACTGFMWLVKGPSDDLCEKVRSIKCGEFL